jgi:transcriptional regulator with XRE-family HTH domain
MTVDLPVQDASPANDLPEEALPQEIGHQIKRRRQVLGFSLRDLGAASGLSASSLSQIERGMVSPTLSTLTAIAQALHVPLFDFFAGSSRDSVVLKKGRHLCLKLPESNIEYELLSRQGSASIAVMRARLQAGHSVYDQPQSHPQEECLLVLQGQVQVWLGGEIILLGRHDSLNFDANTPHRFTAVGEEEAEYILCISPVVF